MHFSLVIFVMVEILSSAFTTAKPRTEIDLLNHADTEEPQQVSEDPDIEEIANREYETVHDRILAVNMAHLEKRKKALRDQETKRTANDTNIFDNIDKDNEAQHIEGLYQGDIIVDEELEELLPLPKQTRTKRNAVRTRAYLWNTRRIPYRVPSYMMHIMKNLLIAIAEFQKHTCLRFVPYQSGIHKNYITFGSSDGCSSRIGKKHYPPGPQTVSIGPACNKPGTIIHELLHAIGFWHEQARPDRDKYVSIKWENIKPGMEDQFDKYSLKSIDQVGMDYDYQSIMHYGRHAFSKNGKPTIVAIGNENRKFGNKEDRLSTKDIIEINALYDCQTTRYGWTKWSEFTPCDKKCYKSRQRYCYHSGNPKSCGGNVNIYGVEKDNQKCSKRECLGRNAVHGHWGHWGAWTTCSATCDEGARSRTRQCNNPAPSKYGKPCQGKPKEDELCTVGRCHLGNDDTEFENPSRPFGMWKNKHGTKLAWIRHQFYTKTKDTGPMDDHTKGTAKGHYLYMESSYPAKPGDQAMLKSPTLTAKTRFQCLKFYYTMYGDTMGSLHVRLYRPGLQTKIIFFKNGNQGEPWHLGTATIEAKTTFSLEIVAKVGKTGYSDIAIDDVYIDDGKCSCQDKYQLCKTWSAKGDCKTNKAWMKKNCPRSCVCGPDAKECKDSNKVQCPLWAKNGECEKKKIFMHQNCKKSCKICKADAKECKDSNKVQCPLWAKNGECEKKKIFMHQNCKKSCKICKADAKECKDSNTVQCPLWAKNGECEKKKIFMHQNCKKSCKICKADAKECKDSNKVQCPLWAKKGECEKYKIFMDKQCPRSCKVCEHSTKECKDSNTVQCPLWAKNGECEKKKIFMHQNCKKSCKICKDVTACADNNPQCSKWAEIGECKTNPVYMDVTCKKSCNKCSA